MDGKLGDKEEELIQLHADRQKKERKVDDQATAIQSLQVRYACTLHIFTPVLCVSCWRDNVVFGYMINQMHCGMYVQRACVAFVCVEVFIQ